MLSRSTNHSLLDSCLPSHCGPCPKGKVKHPTSCAQLPLDGNRQDQRHSCIEAAPERQSDWVGDRVRGRWLFAGSNVVIVTTLVEAAGLEPASTEALAESLQA